MAPERCNSPKDPRHDCPPRDRQCDSDLMSRIGDVVQSRDLVYLDDFARYDLPVLPYGQRYAVVDDRIVVIDPESYKILQLIRVFTALGN